jgi:hypothetical protein
MLAPDDHGRCVDPLGLHLVELTDTPWHFGGDGTARFLTATVGRAGATCIALLQNPALIAPALAGWLSWPFDTCQATYGFEKPRFQEKGLDHALREQADRAAEHLGWMPPPDSAPTATVGADHTSPLMELVGPSFDLGAGRRAYFATAALERVGAVVIAMVVTPELTAPVPAGYLAWALAGDQATQTVVRHPQYAATGLAPAMWAYACRSAGQVDWIGHPQHSAHRTHDGEAFAHRVGGTTCYRCGNPVDLPPRVIVNPGALADLLAQSLATPPTDQLR